MGHHVVLVGSTASGKSAVAKKLVEKGFHKIVTYTTRKPRLGEVHGVDYYFISNEKFIELIRDGSFAEFTYYETDEGIVWYGSTNADHIRDDNTVIILDPAGVKSLKNKSFVVWLDTPEQILIKRALERGDEYHDVMNRLYQDSVKFRDFDITLPNRESHKWYNMKISYDISVNELTSIILSVLKAVERIDLAEIT